VRDPSTRAVLLPAAHEIAPIASNLLYMTMGPLAEYWMGVDDKRRAHEVLSRMFRTRQNLFSHEFATCAQISGEVVGIELSYPARLMKNLEFHTLLQFIRAAGIVTAIRMVVRSFPLRSINDAAMDEYFLAHLGVLPAFEGRGLGRRLLQRAEDRALEAGLTKITLTVDVENARALELYKRAGFAILSTVTLERLRRRFSYRGYHHMTKSLG